MGSRIVKITTKWSRILKGIIGYYPQGNYDFMPIIHSVSYNFLPEIDYVHQLTSMLHRKNTVSTISHMLKCILCTLDLVAWELCYCNCIENYIGCFHENELWKQTNNF